MKGKNNNFGGCWCLPGTCGYKYETKPFWYSVKHEFLHIWKRIDGRELRAGMAFYASIPECTPAGKKVTISGISQHVFGKPEKQFI